MSCKDAWGPFGGLSLMASNIISCDGTCAVHVNALYELWWCWWLAPADSHLFWARLSGEVCICTLSDAFARFWLSKHSCCSCASRGIMQLVTGIFRVSTPKCEPQNVNLPFRASTWLDHKVLLLAFLVSDLRFRKRLFLGQHQNVPCRCGWTGQKRQQKKSCFWCKTPGLQCWKKLENQVIFSASETDVVDVRGQSVQNEK